MAKKNAKDGSFFVNSVQIHVSGWKFDPKVKLADATDSGTTAGFTEDLAGRKSATFMIEGYWNDGSAPLPSLAVGTELVTWELRLYSAVKHSGALAIVEIFSMDTPIGAGDNIKWTCTCKVQGSWTNAS